MPLTLREMTPEDEERLKVLDEEEQFKSALHTKFLVCLMLILFKAYNEQVSCSAFHFQHGFCSNRMSILKWVQSTILYKGKVKSKFFVIVGNLWTLV